MAQYQVTLYTDAGKTVVSDGFFTKMAAITDYQFGKNNITAGLQIDITGNSNRVISGYSASASREWMINTFPIEIQGFFIFSPFSRILKETNWGFQVGTYRNHFILSIGTSFRTYAYTQKAVRDYDLTNHTRIHENWNPVYSLNYLIKPIDNPWNIGLTVTNIDHFTINQDTNPVINVCFTYRPCKPLNCFMESWYKSAGALNLNVNYFGFFFRTGIIWDIT